MKIRLTIVCLIGFFLNSFFAQSNSEITYDMSKDASIIEKTEQNNSLLQINISERTITTAVILGEIGILLVVLFYWKKTRSDSKNESRDIYKKNIKAMRNEKIMHRGNIASTEKRQKLNKIITMNKLNGKTITATSKKLSIAKGEIFLAARIQQLQNQTR